MIPNDRRMGFPVRNIIETIADEDSFLELKKVFGRSIITGFLRIEGKPFAVLANDCQQLGGAIDSSAADKAANFIEICNDHDLPIISFVDTPGFMVGPDSEKEGAFRRMGEFFKHGARIKSPLVGIILRRGYGLGAMAMMGGSFVDPIYTASWPNGEFGGMGLEGYVKLGFKKELEAEETEEKRQALFDKLVAKMYEVGKATEAASYLEMDAVIDPAITRETITKAFSSVGA
jgi:acetyl-CoA carboxylase carboxyltransferase component